MKKLEIRKLGSQPEVKTGKETAKELTAEIMALRKRNKEFAATNDHQTALVVCFSTQEDQNEFAKGVGITPVPGLTLIDGYYLAKQLGKQPQRPKFRLDKPLK